MASIKNLIASLVVMVVVSICGVAQAEVVTYEFTAEITWDIDPNEVIGVDPGQEVHGTFSYDTETSEVISSSSWFGIVNSTQYETGDVSSDAVTIAEATGSADGDYIDGTTVIDSPWFDTVMVADLINGAEVTNLETGETVTVGWAGEVVIVTSWNELDSTDLPSSDELAGFSSGTYYIKVGNGDVTGQQYIALASGRITSITKVSSTSVPELSASGTAASFSLLAGAAFVITSRRRQGENHQS